MSIDDLLESLPENISGKELERLQHAMIAAERQEEAQGYRVRTLIQSMRESGVSEEAIERGIQIYQAKRDPSIASRASRNLYRNIRRAMIGAARTLPIGFEHRVENPHPGYEWATVMRRTRKNGQLVIDYNNTTGNLEFIARKRIFWTITEGWDKKPLRPRIQSFQNAAAKKGAKSQWLELYATIPAVCEEAVQEYHRRIGSYAAAVNAL